ncbi:MAG: TetR/AcrR family transcriptional regulator [Methanobacterium sp.]|uniref:TetR family transcriptional regulator n=1 Tax=Methanobacterium sp. TaxID=2164 RepID=UPI003C784352
MQDTEDKILDATIKLLDKDGWKGATTKKIASEAGVNEITLFRKFHNKEQLLKAAKKRSASRFLEELDLLFKIDDNGDIKSYLTTIWQNASEMIDKRINLIRISMEEVRGIPFEEKVLPKISKMIIEHLINYFQKKIDQGLIRDIDPEVAALNIFSIVFQMDIVWKIYDQKPPVTNEYIMENFFDIFLNGILVHDTKQMKTN